jgi:hypothetical protein
MSIIQVLVGFGLASILGLVLAEMNSSSSKQMGQMRLQFERAAVIQSLQSAISNAQVCEKFLDTNRTFGPTVTDNIPKAGLTTIKANWFYMGTNQTQPIIEGQQIANTSLKVDWIRAVGPSPVNIVLPGTDKVYVADLVIKLSPVNGAADKKMDLKSMTVGKVYYVTTNTMPGGKVKSCYGDAAGAYLCPNANDIQVMSSGSWVCSTLSKALGPVCGSGQLIQSSGNSNTPVTCVQIYTTAAGCAGSGTSTLSATCMTEQCGLSTTSSGSTTYTVNNITVTVPSLDIAGSSFGGANVVTDTSCTTSGGSAGTGSMPGSSGSTSCSSSKVYIPALGAGHNQTNARTISGTGTVTVPTSSSTLTYKTCAGACGASSSTSCNNVKK